MKQAKITWAGTGLQFTGTSEKGAVTPIDGDAQTGGSPFDLLLEAIGSCSSVDVVSILQKQREPLAGLEVTVIADRNATEPRYITALRLRFDLAGDGLSATKAARAISLSISKYCSVYHSIRRDAPLTVEYRVNGGDYAPVEIV